MKKGKYRYDSNDDILNELFKPAMKMSKELMFCTAYFSNQVLVDTFDEISEVLQRGKFRLIVGNETSNLEDIQQLKKLHGDEVGHFIYDKLFKNFQIEDLKKLEVYSKYLKNGKFEVKVGVSTRGGIFHDKSYLFEPYDKSNQPIAAFGSLNFTKAGFDHNYESLNLKESEATYNESKNYFDDLWENSIGGTNVVSIKDVVINLVDQKIETFYEQSPRIKMAEKLRDYQNEAVDAIVNNDYNGILKMATGTGKTFTALEIISRYLFKDKISNKVVVSVPYKHLAEQWADEAREYFGKDLEVTVIHSDSRNAQNEFIQSYQSPFEKNCFIFVNDSFVKYVEKLSKKKINPLLIFDEVHNLSMNNLELLEKYNFLHKVGLSATPEDEFDEERTIRLETYLHGVVFEYSLEKAIKTGFLTEYYYYPKRVDLEEDEIAQYEYLESKLRTGKNKIKTRDEIEDLLSNASRKLIRFKEDFKEYSEKNEKLNHIIVYCSPGTDAKLTGKKHLNAVSSEIHQLNSKVNMKKFTASESTQERKTMTAEFENEEIDVLLAIRCLDEGYNVPAIKTAFLLHSGNRARQHIQRRGRLLRKFNDKKYSQIYDYVVFSKGKIIPSEYNRVKEYSRLAKNKIDLKEWSENE